jgi:cytosine/adenosine deaminase-related metal-dependent hydrolase
MSQDHGRDFGHEHAHAGACFVCAAAGGGRDDAAAAEPPASPGRRAFLGGAAGVALGGTLLAHAGPANGMATAPGTPNAAAFRDRNRRYAIEAGLALVEESGQLRIRRDVTILVNADRIEDVVAGFGSSRRYGNLGRLDARTHLVAPGFISGHTHVAGGTTTRGIIENGRSFARPLELADTLSDDELDAITAFNLAELILSGCTTQVEMALSLKQAESYVRVARRLGARGYPGGMIPGIHRLFPIWFRANDQALYDSVPGTLAEIQANLEFARRNMGLEDGRIQPMMAPHATDTQTPETMRAIAAAARELGTGVHFHLSQSANETNTVKRLWGMTPAQWCDSFGLLDGPFFGAHMSGLDFAVDPPVLNAKGGVYAHCPSAGGAGGGTQPYPEALAKGMRVNIGIDTHSNDYVENLKLAVLYGQARRSLINATSPFPLTNPTMLMAIDGATRIGAAGLRRSDLGRIAPGAKADLMTIDVTGPLVGTGAVPREPLNNLLYAHGLSVRHVLTDGRLQVWNGQFVADDLTRIAREAGAAVERLWGMLAAEGFFG